MAVDLKRNFQNLYEATEKKSHQGTKLNFHCKKYCFVFLPGRLSSTHMDAEHDESLHCRPVTTNKPHSKINHTPLYIIINTSQIDTRGNTRGKAASNVEYISIKKSQSQGGNTRNSSNGVHEYTVGSR